MDLISGLFFSKSGLHPLVQTILKLSDQFELLQWLPYLFDCIQRQRFQQRWFLDWATGHLHCGFVLFPYNRTAPSIYFPGQLFSKLFFIASLFCPHVWRKRCGSETDDLSLGNGEICRNLYFFRFIVTPAPLKTVKTDTTFPINFAVKYENERTSSNWSIACCYTAELKTTFLELWNTLRAFPSRNGILINPNRPWWEVKWDLSQSTVSVLFASSSFCTEAVKQFCFPWKGSKRLLRGMQLIHV